jgi:branched-subunit amino acid transport protein
MPSATVWFVVLAASAVCFALKLAGHLVPQHWLADERVARTAALVTAALLAALVVVQTLGDGRALAVDARLPAVAVAAVALALRAPFVLVVVLAALTAAGLRALGWG